MTRSFQMSSVHFRRLLSDQHAALVVDKGIMGTKVTKRVASLARERSSELVQSALRIRSEAQCIRIS